MHYKSYKCKCKVAVEWTSVEPFFPITLISTDYHVIMSFPFINGQSANLQKKKIKKTYLKSQAISNAHFGALIYF